MIHTNFRMVAFEEKGREKGQGDGVLPVSVTLYLKKKGWGRESMICMFALFLVGLKYCIIKKKFKFSKLWKSIKTIKIKNTQQTSALVMNFV